MPLSRYAPLALLLSAPLLSAHAESNKIAAQYWVDVSTMSMSIPGMPDQGGGMLGGLLGNAMGNAMGGMQGKTVNTELWVRAKPSGTEGTHLIPNTMNMGSSLLLLPIKPVQAQGSTPTEKSDGTYEKPKGRILMYWGCSEEIRKGQPRILDFSSPNYADYAKFFASRGGKQSKGVQGKPGDSVWPNERDNKRVPDNASLQGQHAVTGDGVPSTLKFQVDAAYDFLPKVKLSTKGDPQNSIGLSWNVMDHAKGYFLQAQGAARGSDGSSDIIMWNSSEAPEGGWSLMDYQTPSQVARLQQQKVVLPATASTCHIPKGIFAKAEGGMVNMIAYGPELNASYPARPEKAPKDWQPDWTARVRVKSTGMTMLGMSGSSASSDMADEEERPARRRARQEETSSDEDQGIPAPVKIFKGLFGG
ncbi:MAG: hypothetical protein K0S28_2145 [Paucimonas sp.]|jgi:hypothetical protein|nr:hypothetical protein [Paucimonas sp.]